MLALYFAPRTRSVRVRWLLEELGLPHELRRVPFAPPTGGFFSQSTPLGKFPVLEDDEVTISESGAIVEYVLERYGGGRLAPRPGSPARGLFLQWLHFAEATAFPPLGTIVWHTLYKQDAQGCRASSRTLAVARAPRSAWSNLTAYLQRLEARPAFRRATAA